MLILYLSQLNLIIILYLIILFTEFINLYNTFGVEDIDQSLVGSALKLLPAVLVDMGGAEDGDNLLLGGEGDGAGNLGAVALGGLHDLGCAGVDELMVISLQPDTDHLLVCHVCFPP